MKIGILTQPLLNNYGGLLQNYALQEVLKSYADTVEHIWHERDNFMPRVWYKQWSWKEPIKILLDWRGFRENICSLMFGMEMVRQGKIKDWCDNHISVMKENNISKVVLK